MIPRRLQAWTRSRPEAVNPAPMSGEDGNRNGTPSPNAFGRDQTIPSERSPRSYQDSRSERSGAIASAPSKWTIAFTRPGSRSSTRRTIETSRPSSAASCPSTSCWAFSRGIGSSSGSAYGTSSGRWNAPLDPIGAIARDPTADSAKNPPANPDSRAVARSMCAGSCPSQTRSARSLCPSRITGGIVRTGW